MRARQTAIGHRPGDDIALVRWAYHQVIAAEPQSDRHSLLDNDVACLLVRIPGCGHRQSDCRSGDIGVGPGEHPDIENHRHDVKRVMTTGQNALCDHRCPSGLPLHHP